MNGIDEIIEEVDKELDEDEKAAIIHSLKIERQKTRKRFAWIKTKIQDVKCLFGSHGFIYGAGLDNMFCSHCKRMWRKDVIQ